MLNSYIKPEIAVLDSAVPGHIHNHKKFFWHTCKTFLKINSKKIKLCFVLKRGKIYTGSSQKGNMVYKYVKVSSTSFNIEQMQIKISVR